MVGFYGDPTISWSIVAHAELGDGVRVSPEEVGERFRVAVARFPWLGIAPGVEVLTGETLGRFADEPYVPGASMVRVAVSEAGVMVAGHHGVVDGLGLVALLGIALDVPVAGGARGVGAREARRGFVLSAVSRLGEAVFVPPTRVAPEPGVESVGRDVFGRVDLSGCSGGTAVWVAAAVAVTRRWNVERGRSAGRVVAAVGASRRDAGGVRPEHDAAFFRLRVPEGAGVGVVRSMVARQAPEPGFPARSSRVARWVASVLSGRLGSTFLVSNLGVIDVPGVSRVAFYPAAGGRSGVAFGVATVGERTTVTVRARGRDFGVGAVSRMVTLFAEAARARV